jgi:molecular chaperone GrpE (heat shock protein)
MADSGATGNRDFEDTGENDEALTSKIHEQPHVYSTEQNSAPMHAPKRFRISMNDLLMSKIAQTVLCNFSGFGQHCIIKGNKKRTESIQQLCNLLNEDPDVRTNCSNVELKPATVKEWIDKQGPEYAEAGLAVSKKASATGGETVHGGPSKAQTDWMEVYNQLDKHTKLVESVGKESKSGKMMLKSSAAAEAMFEAASKACGTSQRESAVRAVIDRRNNDGLSSAASSSLASYASSTSSSSQGSGAFCNDTEDDSPEKPAPEKTAGRWKRANSAATTEQKVNSMDKLFCSLEAVLAAHSSASALREKTVADEAQAKRIKAEAMNKEAEAKNKEADAKKLDAQSKNTDALLLQLDKVTSIYKQAVQDGDGERASKYKKIMASLDDQLLAAMGD